MDAAGTERAVLSACLDAGPASLVFAASRPDRVNGLILHNTGAAFVSSEDYDIGVPKEQLSAMLDTIEDGWGTDSLGSGLEFHDRGTHSLNGIPEPWLLYDVRRPGNSGRPSPA